MQLIVETEGFNSLHPDSPSIERDFITILQYAGQRLPADIQGRWSVVLRLVSVDEISKLHATYFNDASQTDVITFPSGELEYSVASGHLGDVAICADVAARQASEIDHSLLRELAFLGLHGLLHLVGYRDATQEERNCMLAFQDRLLDDFERESGKAIS